MDTHANYRRICEVIEHVREGRRITEDWYADQTHFLRIVREFYPDISEMHPEIRDLRFRRFLDVTERMLQDLMRQILERGYFDPKLYADFCQNILNIIEDVTDHESLDGLSGLLDGLTM